MARLRLLWVIARLPSFVGCHHTHAAVLCGGFYSRPDGLLAGAGKKKAGSSALLIGLASIVYPKSPRSSIGMAGSYEVP
jgi:hypothetical protein